MNREAILAQVAGVLAEKFGVEPASVTLEASLADDLDLDSIDAIDMVVRLQELTGQRFGEEELKRIRTVGDVVLMLEPHLSAA